MHPALVVLGAACGTNVDDVGDGGGVVAEDGDGVLEGDSEILEEMNDELQVFLWRMRRRLRLQLRLMIEERS